MIWGAYCTPCIYSNLSSVLPLVNEANNGPIAAAMLAAGIGCLFLGIMTSLSEGIHAVENALNWYNPVGALTGKTIIAIVFWLVSWAILSSKWKDESVNFGKVYNVTLILVALGVLGTFPLFFGLL